MEAIPATLLKTIKINGILLIVFFAVAIAALFVGSVEIDFWKTVHCLLRSGAPEQASLPDLERTILYTVRLPRIILAGLVGASLATAGVIFQALLRNPLADPYILGLSGGSAVGAILGIIFGAGAFSLGIPGTALAGAFLSVAVTFGIAGRNPQTNTILLTGVIVNAFFSAVILFLVSISTKTHLQNILFWLMGDLSSPSAEAVAISAFSLFLAFIMIYLNAHSLNLMSLGEETASQLGVRVERTKIILFGAASLLTAMAVSFSGIIGFVGLIIPHMMRLAVGADHRILLPASLIFGGIFLIVSDAVARSVLAPVELPVGVVTAFCGAPYFIYLLRRREY